MIWPSGKLSLEPSTVSLSVCCLVTMTLSRVGSASQTFRKGNGPYPNLLCVLDPSQVPVPLYFDLTGPVRVSMDNFNLAGDRTLFQKLVWPMWSPVPTGHCYIGIPTAWSHFSSTVQNREVYEITRVSDIQDASSGIYCFLIMWQVLKAFGMSLGDTTAWHFSLNK